MTAASLILAGCSSSDGDNVSVPLYRGEPNGDDAALQGILVVDGRCLYAEGRDGERYLPAFPEVATTWDADAAELTLGGQVAGLGEKVMFGGSQNTRPVDAIDWKVAPLDTCDTSRLWISGGSIIVEP